MLKSSERSVFMAIKDILLVLKSYPEPTSDNAIEYAVLAASAVGAHIAAIACETHVEVPSSLISSSLINIPAIIAEEGHKSRLNADKLLSTFEGAAVRQGVLFESIRERALSGAAPALFTEYARLRDLAIVPLGEDDDQSCLEAVIFGSGRPTLVVPERSASHQFQLRTAVIAWDFSRTAARAVADALPFLQRAKQVRIVTVSGEKSIETRRSAEELAKNLSRHGLDVVLDRVTSKGEAIGDMLESHVRSCNADMLVMGAYGHTRLREFVLGGATRSLLAKPPLPILFSH
jgi:nucleotide-binding universal stress UspA family protein